MAFLSRLADRPSGDYRLSGRPSTRLGFRAGEECRQHGHEADCCDRQAKMTVLSQYAETRRNTTNVGGSYGPIGSSRTHSRVPMSDRSSIDRCPGGPARCCPRESLPCPDWPVPAGSTSRRQTADHTGQSDGEKQALRARPGSVSRKPFDVATSALGNWQINRMAGTSSTLPQAHRTVRPAWLTSTATDLPQEHGSKYFIAGCLGARGSG